MSENKACEKSPDKKHHYEMSTAQHAVYVINGAHTCYQCHYCNKKRCETTTWDPPNPLTFPTDEDFDHEN